MGEEHKIALGNNHRDKASKGLNYEVQQIFPKLGKIQNKIRSSLQKINIQQIEVKEETAEKN